MGIIRQLASDRGGAVILIFGLSLLMLGMSVGLAIDGGRAYSVASRIGAALDAAALSGAKQLNETESSDDHVTTTTLATLDAHLASLGVGGVTFNNKLVTIDRASSSVTVLADVAVATTLGKMSGINLFDFSKQATTIYQQPKIELLLALDVTGSMNSTPSGDSVTKITALKSVAKELIDSVFDLAVTDSNVRIGLVPWSSAVNAGTLAAAATGGAVATGCLIERTGTGATTDEAPSPLNYAYPFAPPYISGASGYTCPDDAVTPLTGRAGRNALRTQIDSLNATGNTAGHIGTAWAWYLVSPSWASHLPSASQPNGYGSATVKNVVIMTDGIFNTSYVGGPPAGTSGYDDTSYSLFQTICTNMRARNVNVYTIGFDLDDARALSELQTCAGSTENFFNAGNANQLRTAFRTIAERMNTIRVSR